MRLGLALLLALPLVGCRGSSTPSTPISLSLERTSDSPDGIDEWVRDDTQLGLHDAWFSADARNGWAVGHGVVLALEDGRWRLDTDASRLMADVPLSNIYMNEDGSAGWAIGGPRVFEYQAPSHAVGAAPSDIVGWREDLSVSDLGHRGALKGLWMSKDARHGWIYSGKKMLEVVDGRWSVDEDGTSALRGDTVVDVWIDDEGQYGWAIGNRFALRLAAGDWSRVRGISGELNALWVDTSGRNGWLVGSGVWRLSDAGWALDLSATEILQRFESTLTWLQIEPSGESGWAGNRSMLLRLEKGQWAEASDALRVLRGVGKPVWTSTDGSRVWVKEQNKLIELVDGEKRDRRFTYPSILQKVGLNDSGEFGWFVASEAISELGAEGLRPVKDIPALAEGDDDLEHLWVDPTGERGWAFGSSGTVLKLANATWIPDEESIASLDGHSIQALWVSGDGRRGWAVAQHAFLRLEDGEWRPAEIDSRRMPSALWVGPDEQSGWALGSKVALKLDPPGTWVPHDVPESLGYVSEIWVNPKEPEGWAVGSHISRLAGLTWSREPDADALLDDQANLQHLWIDAHGENGWAMGREAALQLDDGHWKRATIGASIKHTDLDICGLWLSENGQFGWAANGGQLLRLTSSDSWVQTHQFKGSACELQMQLDERGVQGWALGSVVGRLTDGQWEEFRSHGIMKDFWMRADGKDGWTVGNQMARVRYKRQALAVPTLTALSKGSHKWIEGQYELTIPETAQTIELFLMFEDTSIALSPESGYLIERQCRDTEDQTCSAFALTSINALLEGRAARLRVVVNYLDQGKRNYIYETASFVIHPPTVGPWWRTVKKKSKLWLLLIHPFVWLCFFTIYPKSSRIRALFFWNPIFRNVVGFGYVGVALVYVGWCRRRMLAPFRTSLAQGGELRAPDWPLFPMLVRRTTTKGTLPITELPARSDRLTILQGDSGLGKSTFLHDLMRRSEEPIVCVRAAHCGSGVISRICALLPEPFQKFKLIESFIHSGGLWVCIDGLNEADPAARAEIDTFLRRHDDARIIVTTQTMHWVPPAWAVDYELQPLSEEHVLEYLRARVDENRFPAVQAFIETCRRKKDSLDTKVFLDALSNPLDLDTIASLFRAGVDEPDIFRLHEQQYDIMAQAYRVGNATIEFPLPALIEESYRSKLESTPLSPEVLPQRAWETLLYRRFVLRIGDELRFRHDRLQDYFVAHALLAKASRQIEHAKDPRFRGVYLILATLAPPEVAEKLRLALSEQAAEDLDHTLSDEFIRRVKYHREWNRANGES